MSMGLFSCDIFTKTAPSLLKLKNNFANSQLERVEMHPGEWIKISVSTKISDEEFMIHVLNNLTEEYGVVLDRIESIFMLKKNDLFNTCRITQGTV